MKKILSILCLIIPLAIHAQNHYKLYCMYTPKYENLYRNYFLPSIKDDFEIIKKEYPEECPTGIFRSKGWDKVMLHKLEFLEEAILDNWDNQVFFYSDIDIIFLKPIIETSLAHLGKKDFVVQQGWPQKKLCAGFFVMRGNKKTLQLVKKAQYLLRNSLVKDDQVALQAILKDNSTINWGFLPSEQYPNGSRLLQQAGLYSEESKITLNDSIVLFHATHCHGLELKYHYLSRVQELYTKISTILDVESLPTLRTQQYSMGPHKQIIVFSAPRTGSSLVYNIFRFLFEDSSYLTSYHNDFNLRRKVLKTHRFNDLGLVDRGEQLYIFTLRDPYMAGISNYRISLRKKIYPQSFAKFIINFHRDHLLYSQTLENEGRSLYRLKFEEFTKNIDSIFTFIEKEFSLLIAPRDKELMRKGFSKENIYACTKHLSSFAESLPISGFHGKHVSLEQFTPPKEFLHWLGFYCRTIAPLFRPYGYYLDAADSKR